MFFCDGSRHLSIITWMAIQTISFYLSCDRAFISSFWEQLLLMLSERELVFSMITKPLFNPTKITHDLSSLNLKIQK